MKNLAAGLVAGLAATVVLSVLMQVKAMMGVMPELDVIKMLGAMTGMGDAMGWAGHFMIGTLAWGGGFAVLYKFIPGGGAVTRGVVFGLGAWLMMMLAVMPMAGAGLFGMNMGIMAPMMTAALHIVFGAVLGFAFRRHGGDIGQAVA